MTIRTTKNFAGKLKSKYQVVDSDEIWQRKEGGRRMGGGGGGEGRGRGMWWGRGREGNGRGRVGGADSRRQ